MRVLAFNCGSSSIKCALVDTRTRDRAFELTVAGIGDEGPRLTINGQSTSPDGMRDVHAAIGVVMTEALIDRIGRDWGDFFTTGARFGKNIWLWKTNSLFLTCSGASNGRNC